MRPILIHSHAVTGTLGRPKLRLVLLHVVQHAHVAGQERLESGVEVRVALHVDGKNSLRAVVVGLGLRRLLLLGGNGRGLLALVPVLSPRRVGFGLGLGPAGGRLGQAKLGLELTWGSASTVSMLKAAWCAWPLWLDC